MNLIYKTTYQNISTKKGYEAFISQMERTKALKKPYFNYLRNTSYYSNSSRDINMFYELEYDLSEVGRAMDTESYLAISFSKKINLLLKNGFTIIGKNEKNVEYIKQRLKEICYMSKTDVFNFVKSILANLIIFHNAFIAKVRNESASTGLKKKMIPVAGLFVLPPESMKLKVDKMGEVLMWRQQVNHTDYRDFSPSNIYHITYNQRSGFNAGVPVLEYCRDDILALRRIEESIETLIHKMLFPILHLKVGTDQHPAITELEDGSSEIERAKRLLQTIEDSGGLATSHRYELKSIGSESKALRVEAYLNHFKTRVFAALGMSGMDFGEGMNTGKATGSVLSQTLIDNIKSYKVVLENWFNEYLFKDLLCETKQYNYPYEIPEEDEVYIKFSEIDSETKIKMESHTSNMFNNNLLTYKEARELMNLPIEVDEKELNFNKFKQKEDPLQSNIAKPKNQYENK